MCKLVVSLLLPVLFEAVSAQIDWCKVCQEHTLCVYPNPNPAAKCNANDGLGGTLSDDDKKSIVDLHNQMRQTVAKGNETRGSPGPQPRAKSGSMPNLQWDDTLAVIAQRWADQCNFGHDACRNVPAYPVGQNIASSSTTRDVNNIRILDMVQMWYDEVQKFNKDEVKKYVFSPATGHYTQIVWAKTTKIGCGLRNYKERAFNKRFLVCNYGPSGNYVGEAVYET